jgi:hypothetical protein
MAARRRTVLAGAAVVAVVAGAALGGLALTSGRVGGQGTASTEEDGGSGVERGTARTTAAVTRRDLVEREELDGTLGFGKSHELALGGAGVVTALAQPGTVVDRGGLLGEVNGRPVPLLLGSRPLWRTIGADADTSDGPDIRQLEENLIALGHGTAEELGPNDTWSQATTRAVQSWQQQIGVPATGRVEPGSVVFWPTAVRVASHRSALGAPAGQPALEVTGTGRQVTIALEADRQGVLGVGRAVTVRLPDGTGVAATVRSVAAVVDPPTEQGGEATVEVVVTPDDAAAAGHLDQAPVEVEVVTVAAAGVLTVPGRGPAGAGRGRLRRGAAGRQPGGCRGQHVRRRLRGRRGRGGLGRHPGRR